MLTKEDLDQAQCQQPGCTEIHGPFFLHGRCHMNAASFASTFLNPVLTIRCSECNRGIAEIAISEAISIRANCHPHTPVWASYESGNVQINCAVCDALIATIPVASETPTKVN